MSKSIIIDVPSWAAAQRIARGALRYMMTTAAPHFTGDLADALSQEWVFGRAAHASNDGHDVDCTCADCKASRKIDAPILAAIQRAFTNDEDIIDRLASYIVMAAEYRATRSEPPAAKRSRRRRGGRR